MGAIWTLALLVICGIYVDGTSAQKGCPMPKAILPCRCFIRGDEYQIWCTHSDLPSVLDGLKEVAKFIPGPIEELILENNYLPALPGRTFFPLKILRLMLRHNGLERVSNDWLGGLETTIMELFMVEPKLRSMPEDSLMQMIALQAVTIQSNLMKRLPMFSGLPKLRYLQIESTSLLELTPNNFKDNPSLENIHIAYSPRLKRLEAHVFIDLPSLKLLNISYCGITWIHPRAITRLPLLQELILIGNRISDAGMVGRVSREMPQLTVLRLDDNYIDRLEEAAFVDLPSLRSLHMSNNRITELHHGAFHRVPRLKKLNLNDNFLKRVHPESFLQESGSGLEELWLIRNEISHVADLRAILDALPRLVFLDMSYNHLEAIPYGSLRGHPTLEHFNLDHNNIHLIDREAFVAMPALRELRMKNNSLSNTLQPPLWNLPDLKGLDLSLNSFRRLEPNFLQDLPSLRKLDLSGNELKYIDPAAFAPTPSLEHINVSYNHLATLHPATFRHLLGLYELDVSNNMLVEFVPGLPRGLEYLHLKNNEITVIPVAPTPDLDLPMLRMLDLSGNKIEVISKERLTSLPQLRRLYLRYNLLKKIEDGSLKGLDRLETLDLSHNGLVHLGANTFKHQTELRDLNLGNNRIEFVAMECFHYAPYLKRLNLTKNMLNEILPSTLDKNKDLQMVDISYNRLIRLSTTFIGLKNLRGLDATHNRLNSIDPQILASLTSLRILGLSHNYIKALKENAFSKLNHLITLDLEDNELELVEPNALKTLPVLKKVQLGHNKIKEIPGQVFVNLPSLQMVELQHNQIRSIAPNAFVGVPQLLVLNISHNEIGSLNDAGLRDIKSLELLDISHNNIKSVANPALERLEWLVELRIDDNQICGVQGSPFNNMPRLRVLTMRNNKMMSFPEGAIERIRNNLATLDIDGNPLACSCNMLWLQAWLHETDRMGPRCVEGYLLREMAVDRRDCPEEARNIELVAPGCESELLSAPGVYGTSQVHSQWMNLKAVNSTQDRNGLAPTPEESEYFYDEYVDYPYNETNGKLTGTTKQPIDFNLSKIHATGNTPTIYAAPTNNKNQIADKEIPKEVNNSPSSSGFTFFGLPLASLGNLLSNAIKPRRNSKIGPVKMDDRIAIVNKSPIPHGSRVYHMPPDMPKFETGGFIPILPGTGGFKPIPNPVIQQTEPTKSQNVTNILKPDSSTVEANNVLISTTDRIYTTEALPSTPQRSTLLTPTSSTSTTTRPTVESTILPINDKPENTRTIKQHFINFTSPNSRSDSKQMESSETTTETVPETTTAAIEETTILKLDTTTVIETYKTTVLKPIKSDVVASWPKGTTSTAAFLAPGGMQSHKKMASIEKVISPNIPSASAPLISEEHDALSPMAHNREPKNYASSDSANVNTDKTESNDLSWYFATYNNPPSHSCSRGSYNLDFVIFLMLFEVLYLLL
ncbi:protein artichoke [Anthonomus grandis grandis]|uniref:protein artichoke n=1 Tax=Anthonomus grandis grandis TaxID=2921223 RepID=UPI002166382B|nr:protein artichoke [Anthonomus grandis grandis]